MKVLERVIEGKYRRGAREGGHWRDLPKLLENIFERLLTRETRGQEDRGRFPTYQSDRERFVRSAYVA